MRIDLNVGTTEAAFTNRSRQVQGEAVVRDSQSPETSLAEGSSFHSRLQTLQAVALASPEVRQEKVERIARAIREGSYRVTPEQTAQAFMAEIPGRNGQ